MRRGSEYTIYKGEEIICSGSVAYCAEVLGVSERTVYFYASPAHMKRIEKGRKNIVAVNVGPLESEDIEQEKVQR